MEAKIYDIDFRVPVADFNTLIGDFLLNNYSHMKSTSSERSTRNGKIMYEFHIICDEPDNENETIVLFEKDASTGDVICSPTGFASFNNSFYKQNITSQNSDFKDYDTMKALNSFLDYQARKQQGLYVSSIDDDVCCIVNGTMKQGKLCVVDSSKNVYGAEDVKSIDFGSSSGLGAVHYDTYIGPWVKAKRAEDPDFEAEMSAESDITKKMYIVAKYLIKLKTQEEVETKEFRDLFAQCGALDKLASDRVLGLIYKLLD